MVLKARSFVPNVDQDIVVKIGSHEQTFKLKQGVSEVTLGFDLGSESVNSIELLPHDAKSPAELGINGDTRKLGLGFIQLRFFQ